MARECFKGERKMGRKLGGGGPDLEVLKGIQGVRLSCVHGSQTPQVVRTHQGLKSAGNG